MRRLASAVSLLPFLACSATGARAEPLSCASRAEVRSLDDSRKAVLSVHNGCGSSVRLVWIDYRSGRRVYADIGPGQSREQYTYETHPWLIEGRRGQCLGLLVVSGPSEAVDVCGAPRS